MRTIERYIRRSQITYCSLVWMLACLSHVAQAQPLHLQWADVTHSAELKRIDAIKVDGEGNTLLVISTTSPFSFAGQLIPFVSQLGGYAFGPTLIKLDPEGNVLWHRSLRGPLQNSVACRDLDVDQYNNIYVNLNSWSTSENAGTIGGLHVFSSQIVDHFLVKISPEGNGLWYKTANLDNTSSGGMLAVKVGGDGVYSMGILVGSANFDGLVLNNSGLSSRYLVKHDLDGNVQWGQVFGANFGYVSAWRLMTEADGSVYIPGTWEGETLPLGDFSVENDLAHTGNSDRWICKINSAGVVQWLVREHSADHEWLSNIVLTPEGEVLVISEHRDGVLHVGNFSLGAPGIVLSRYSADGEVLSAALIGDILSEDWSLTGNWDYEPSILADGSGNYYVMAAFTGSSFQFGGITIHNSGGNTGTSDLFVAKMDKLGQAEWVYQIGSPENELGNFIDLSPSGQLTVAGRFTGLELNIQGTWLEPHTPFNQEVFVASFSTALNTRTAEALQQLLAHPNPFSENVQFDAEALKAFQNATLTVYSSSGTEVHRAAWRDIESGQISLAHLPQGAYVAKISDGVKSLHTKIIKQ